MSRFGSLFCSRREERTKQLDSGGSKHFTRKIEHQKEDESHKVMDSSLKEDRSKKKKKRNWNQMRMEQHARSGGRRVTGSVVMRLLANPQRLIWRTRTWIRYICDPDFLSCSKSFPLQFLWFYSLQASLHLIKSIYPDISGLHDFFIAKYGENSPSFKLAQRNFVESMVGYSLVCYLLQVCIDLPIYL